jgi:hypothetical protein
VAVAIATLVVAPLHSQAPISTGPTVATARVAFVPPAAVRAEPGVVYDTPGSCGSHFKNAVMLGLGFALATGVIELTYTIIREPVNRNGHDWPAADPMLIAWAGGAGFVIGLVGTELCQRRRR